MHDILPDFKLGISQDFHETPHIKFHGNPSSGSRADTCEQKDMTNLIGAFCNYENVPKNESTMFPTEWDSILGEKGQGAKLSAYRTLILDYVDTVSKTHFNNTILRCFGFPCMLSALPIFRLKFCAHLSYHSMCVICPAHLQHLVIFL